jgi:pilus assembly protein Flp/PilA
MLSMFRKLVKNEEGATAIEYGLIAALISIAAIAAFTAVGTGLSAVMTSVSGKLQ